MSTKIKFLCPSRKFPWGILYGVLVPLPSRMEKRGRARSAEPRINDNPSTLEGESCDHEVRDPDNATRGSTAANVKFNDNEKPGSSGKSNANSLGSYKIPKITKKQQNKSNLKINPNAPNLRARDQQRLAQSPGLILRCLNSNTISRPATKVS